ncbi:MAG: CDP-alcohol phosphatidyltransferase family protein [Gammaproteobacteria bacterium]|nr:CDP-alcohol phosphatidyltransferase family protein [Gammaproteobacteria bacterium]MDH3410018.1 CDP-alcohol phosphatidyltransferase family protein [Gammaproteobacteria bacterium]MDH3552193.1 CDP-alcohol phosphatidyltransferase family protein [Gammaproteobacteria bacterium]
MTIYDLKPAFQNLLRPICKRLADAGYSANQVTVAALLFSIIVGLLFALSPTKSWAALLIPVWLFLRMALNAIDGMLAREHNMQSDLGGILNELGDVVSDTALYLPFAVVPGIPAMLVVSVVLLSILTEMAGVVAVQIGASRRYDGPMGKSDRAFVFGLLGLLLGIGLNPGWWSTAILAAVAVLAALTTLNRCARALAERNSA